MPIFMDLHIIPGVKAKDVAEAHQQDLLIQNKFSCTCMTYWIDESRNSVFCLIDAPDANSVRELHNSSHGLAPHKIIPVSKTVVESFLGRIYDPHIPGAKEGDLKVFNDPAFRTLVIVKIPEMILLHSLKPSADELLEKYWKILPEKAAEFEGEVTEQNENVTSIISFSSPAKAVSCAIAIRNEFNEEERKLLNLKIAINAGVPVAESRRLFGDTIDLAKQLFYLPEPDRIKIAAIIKKSLDQKHLERIKNETSGISTADEKILNKLLLILEENIGNEHFGIEELSDQMAQSKSSLNRTTQSLTGKSPNSLIKEFRLNKSLELLKENNYPVSQIAFITGFSSPSYFSKCFKEHFGISPSLFPH